MAKKTDLTIIILSYNSQFWLKQTLTSFKKWVIDRSRFHISVVVVDNASQDDSLTLLEKQFSWVKVIALPENRGFSAGNNVALAQVTSSYAMLLNSDVEATAESDFDRLLEYMEEHPDVGIITPALKLQNGQLDWASHRGEPTLWAAATYFSGLARLFPQSSRFGQYHLTYANVHEIHPIDACSGAAMVIRTAAMKKVGLLDEQFFFYAEDLDWCRRFRQAGWQIIFFPLTTLIHHKYKSGLASTSEQTKRKTRRYFYDTMLQYYDKHYRHAYPAWVRWVVKQVLTIKKGGL